MMPSFVNAEELVKDLYAEVYRRGGTLVDNKISNMLVKVEVKKCNDSWPISDWTWSNGIFYENLHGEGLYRAEVMKFLFGTYYGSCPVFFKFDGIQQANIKLNILSFPFRCPPEIACITDEDSINP
ncbi:MAG: hypothetical protein SVR94_07360 [Pseudomonadota bacterium]|nr:hypothetical protein [Pseudomonadota bacterium]